VNARDENIEIYTRHAIAALSHYDLPASSTARLISLSENATFIVKDEKPLGVLRIYLSNAGRPDAIRSELAWIDALRGDGAVDTPAIRRTRNNDVIARFEIDGESRVCSLFEYVPGSEITDHTPATYETVGRIAAQIHSHSRHWQRPADFTRRTWDLEAILGEGAEWGDWRDGPGLDENSRNLLERTEAVVRQRLANYTVDGDRGGLAHCDLRAANLMIGEDGRIWAIDFDDCGFSWFLWDLCSTTTFIEHLPEVDGVAAGWLKGYQTVRKLSADDLKVVPDLVMLRRLHIFAWLGSHPQSDLAQSLKETYCPATCEVAQKYLDGNFLTGTRQK